MLIGIQDELTSLAQRGLLQLLLADCTTARNIRWATDACTQLGACYARDAEITPERITGDNAGIIRNRALKDLGLQSDRTKRHAEVFTPLWVCTKMLDEVSPEATPPSVEPDTDYKTPDLTPQELGFIQSRYLEITCGEAPFLVQRYDPITGERLEVEQRDGILDRKIRLICRKSTDEKTWLKLVVTAYQTTYGYELQGDSLLIARLNMYMTFEEYLEYKFHRKPSLKEIKQIIEIITWNVWQMNGLTGHTPCDAEPSPAPKNLFDLVGLRAQNKPKPCLIRFYNNTQDKDAPPFVQIPIIQIALRGDNGMKFDYIVGNPPYQEEVENNGRSNPIYWQFMDESYKLSTVVELIHPARFLYNAGQTPKAWNTKILSDKHIKVIYCEQKSDKVFPNTDIKGGIAITYHDNNKSFGPIGLFTSFPELTSAVTKIAHTNNIKTIIHLPNKFNLDNLYQDFPEYRQTIKCGGKDKLLRSNIFNKLSCFKNIPNANDDIKVIGISQLKRTWKYLAAKYIDILHENLYKYKVLLPESNGSGAIGEVLSTPLIGEPLIGEPLIGYTQSFIGIGAFDTMQEAENCMKYIKSKFARCMLGILKITQHNPPETWKYVPLQDFTENSDIDWSRSIPEIDQQLYKKYGLDDGEIEFIETNVKAMD